MLCAPARPGTARARHHLRRAWRLLRPRAGSTCRGPAGRRARAGSPSTASALACRLPSSRLYVPAGSSLRAPAGGPPFDHTSIISTSNALFDLGAPLSDRAAARRTCVPTWLARAAGEHGTGLHRRDQTQADAGGNAIDARLARNSYQRRLRWPGALMATLAARAAAHTHRPSGAHRQAGQRRSPTDNDSDSTLFPEQAQSAP